MDGLVAVDDLADDPGGYLGFLPEDPDDGLGVVVGHDHHHADAHVEDPVHLLVGDVAVLLEPGEDGGQVPARLLDPDGGALGQDARRVVDQAAAGDVGDAVDDPLDAVVPVDRLHGADVDPGRLQVLVGEGPAELGDVVAGLHAGVLGDLAREAVSVGVQARAGQPDDLVPRADLLAVEDVLAFDHPEAEAGEVVFARVVEVGQDGRLAAEQGAFGLDAAVGDPLHHRAGEGRVVAAHGDVVEKQEGFGAGAEAVVDRHGDEVDADGAVLAGGEGELELGPDAVGGGDEDGVVVLAGEQADVVVEPEEAGEAVLPVHDPRAVGPLEERRQGGHGLLIGVEVDPGGLVVDGRSARLGGVVRLRVGLAHDRF